MARTSREHVRETLPTVISVQAGRCCLQVDIADRTVEQMKTFPRASMAQSRWPYSECQYIGIFFDDLFPKEYMSDHVPEEDKVGNLACLALTNCIRAVNFAEIQPWVSLSLS